MLLQSGIWWYVYFEVGVYSVLVFLAYIASTIQAEMTVIN